VPRLAGGSDGGFSDFLNSLEYSFVIGHSGHFNGLKINPIFDVRTVATKFFDEIYEFG
jgi:hypothetical protein